MEMEARESASEHSSRVGEFFSETGRRKRSGSSVIAPVDVLSLLDFFN
jgi:hypothetical protein